MKTGKFLAAVCGCFALLFGATAARAAETTTVAKIGKTPYSSLNEALKAAIAANDGVSFTKVEIVDDVVFTDADDWNPVVFTQKKRIEVVGVGENRKIVGLPKSLFTTVGTGNSGQMLRMRDLKFESPKAENPGDYASAVILGYCDVVFEMTFENVWIDGATVVGKKHAGAFLGYVALYAPENSVTFTNCKVTRSRISCVEGSAGGLAGHANGNANGTVTAVDCEISGNEIVSGNTEDLRAGSVFGTVGNAPVSVSAKVSDNTVMCNGTTITTVCGRQGSAGGRLTIMGGTYDHAPIADADAAWAGVSAACALTTTQVDGKTVYTVAKTAVAKIKVGEVETEYADLAAALKAAVSAKNATVTILRDITFGPNDTWTPVKIGSDKTLVVNGNGKTITGLPGCLFGSMLDTGDVQDGSSLTMTNLKFVNPKKIRVNQPKSAGPSFAAVVLALAYGMDVTFDGVEIEGADVRGGDDCFVAGFVGWCNGMSGGNTVTLRNCALRNSTLVSCGSAGGLVAYTTVTPNQAVELVIENCEVTGNTIVCTELKDGALRTDIVGSVVASIGAGDATVSATVSGNSVYGSTSAIDAETLAKDTDEVTTVYGRGKGGTLALTGGSYDHAPIAAADAAWATVAKGCTLAGNDTDGWTVEYFVKANGVGYVTLEAAFAAAEPDADGVVTYEIGGKAEVTGAAWVKILKGGLAGVTQVKFVGTTDDAEICLVTAGSILSDQAYDVDVTLTDLTLSRLNPTYPDDIGFGARYFSTWLRNLNAAENTVTYTRCTFPNGVCNNQYGKTVFNDCTFNNQQSGGDTGYNLWVYGGDVKVNGGTFTGTRGVKVYNEGAARDDIAVTITGTTFDGLTEKSAILASKPCAVAVANVTVKDCAKGLFTRDIVDDEAAIAANGTGISGTFAITSATTADAAKEEFNLTGGTFTAAVDADYCAKGYEPTVNDDGTWSVTMHVVAKVGDKEFNSLADALKAAIAAKNATVEIVDDITFEDGDTWEPVVFSRGKTLVVNGNGKTITGLPEQLLNNGLDVEPYGNVLRISNLTFLNPKASTVAVQNSAGEWFGSVGVILGYTYGLEEVTLDGVVIDGADVRGHGDCFAAGFLAWCNGFEGVMSITIKNCALRNSTIVGGGSAGGLIAFTSNDGNLVDLTVENTVVENNTIVCTEAGRTDKAGAVIATIGASGAEISATTRGNKVYSGAGAVADTDDTNWKTGTEITTVYGRHVGPGTLALTGGSYDKRPFNEGDEWAKVGEWSELVEQDGVFKVVDNLATLGNVKARQRYPWNGLVDITFELKSKNAARVFIVAEYVDGGETKRLPMAAAKLVNDDKSESDVNVSTGFTVPAQATAKTIHVIWDSTAAVPTRLSGVTFKVYAK